MKEIHEVLSDGECTGEWRFVGNLGGKSGPFPGSHIAITVTNTHSRNGGLCLDGL
jgi:hypothetical protein